MKPGTSLKSIALAHEIKTSKKSDVRAQTPKQKPVKSSVAR
jgi:hypothetical protein